MTNKELVLKFYEEVFNAWDVSKIDDYMLDSYKQHNPTVKDGKAGFVEFAQRFFTQKPQMEIVKIVCEDDMVVVFFKCSFEGGNVAKVFDMYRIEDGKLAEHWDCVMGGINTMECAHNNGQF